MGFSYLAIGGRAHAGNSWLHESCQASLCVATYSTNYTCCHVNNDNAVFEPLRIEFNMLSGKPEFHILL